MTAVCSTRTCSTVGYTLARILNDILDLGLCSGLGNAKPGEVCVEAAINLAMGKPNGDRPDCVHPAIHGLMINLNDRGSWRNPLDRAASLKRLALAHLGSSSLSGPTFHAKLARRAIEKIILPIYDRLNTDSAGVFPSDIVRCFEELRLSPTPTTLANLFPYNVSSYLNQGNLSYLINMVNASNALDCGSLCMTWGHNAVPRADTLRWTEEIIEVLREMDAPGIQWMEKMASVPVTQQPDFMAA